MVHVILWNMKVFIPRNMGEKSQNEVDIASHGISNSYIKFEARDDVFSY